MQHTELYNIYAEGVEPAKKGLCSDSGVPYHTFGMSAALPRRFRTEYVEPSFCGTLGTRSGSGCAPFQLIGES